MFRRHIALALGGGGARGLAHIGVLRALEASQVPIHLIVGASMGSIVGGLYAQTGDARLVEAKIREFLQSSLFTHQQPQPPKGAGSFLDQVAESLWAQIEREDHLKDQIKALSDRFLSTLSALFPQPLIENCRIPYAAIAADLRSGEEIILDSGSMAEAVYASSAMPGIFAPQRRGEQLLVDGAATSAIPVRAARSLAPDAKIIAVDVSSQLARQFNEHNVLGVILRSGAVTGHHYHQTLAAEADVLIRPHVKLFNWSEFGNIDDFIAEGEQATISKLPEIKRLMRLW